MPENTLIDLHMHSTVSDGVLSPEDLMEKAHASGVDLLALTDHDTMRGVDRARRAAEGLSMTFIAGVELSTTTHGRSCHLLGYFAAPEPTGDFLSFLDEMLAKRERRFAKMVGKFAKIGITLNADRVRELAAGGALTRPHVARVLIEQGLVEGYQEAFDRYLANGGPCYVAYEKLPTSEAIGRVHAHGGIASVAHPGIEKFTETELGDLKKAGLDAIEVYHFDHDAASRRHYAAIASRLGLLATGGSDYHGTNHRSFYQSDTEEGGVPPHVRDPFFSALRRAATTGEDAP